MVLNPLKTEEKNSKKYFLSVYLGKIISFLMPDIFLVVSSGTKVDKKKRS